MNLLPSRLHSRLVLIISLVLLATTITYSWVTSSRQAAMYQRLMQENASAMAENFAESCAAHLVTGDYAQLEEFLLRAAHLPNILRLQVCEADGTPLSDIRRLAPESLPVVNTDLEPLIPPRSLSRQQQFQEGQLTVWHPIRAGSLLGWVRATFSMHEVAEMKGAIWRWSSLTGAVWIILSVGIFALLLRSPLASISRVSAFAGRLKEMAGEQLEHTDNAHEISQMVQSLNEASRQLLHARQELVAKQEGLEKALQEQERAAAEVQRLNAALEERVAERTAQLESMNESLRQEVEQRRRAQEEIAGLNDNLRRQKAALEAVNQELESFSYSVSHDLRAPLRHIAGFSRLLADDYRERIDEQGRQYIARMQAGTERMSRLIDGLLLISRLGRQEMKRSEVDLAALADEVIAELRRDHPERQVRFSRCGSGATVSADPVLMRVVMENLLRNAWKYTGNRTEAEIEFGVDASGGTPSFCVRDNGAGFDMAYAEKLFAPFQRLHREAEFEGNGIGLATVQRIVRRHGGEIWARGEVGKGAVFCFTMPAEPVS
jgi:signal transduction histidine kinase